MMNSYSLKSSCRATVITFVLLLCVVVIGVRVRAVDLPSTQDQRPGEQRLKADSGKTDSNAEAMAKETFDRLKKLEGKWLGKSTKGWEETITFKTIAGGSVVHESSFDAHPNETMATMYYLDGNRLLLTHYCVSKTQPRLQASAFDDAGPKNHLHVS